MTVRTRFAPSPTGDLHIGGARTALFSWLYARKHGGTFILRIEDTDLMRSTPEAVNAILEGMAWLGLRYDEGPFRQTERFARYQQVIEQLLKEGKAYRCYCSKARLDKLREEQMVNKEKPRYDGHCRYLPSPPIEATEYVVRFKTPLEGITLVEDQVRGKVIFQNSELDDLIIARSDGTPTYNFSVVVDDFDMGITHVIRGDDHLNNTPRQINILKAFCTTLPVYAHLPMILGPDGTKLSKRHGAVGVMQYRDDGYLPEAMLNYLVRLGWSHGDQEIFSVEEMVRLFDIQQINNSASAINPSKLLWLNQHYIKTLDPAYIAQHLNWHLGQLGIDPTINGPNLIDVVLAYRERAKTLKEIALGSIFFYRDFSSYHPGTEKYLDSTLIAPFVELRDRLARLPSWDQATLHQILSETAEVFHLKLGKLAQPLRVAITGGAVSPPIDVTLYLIGQTRALARLERAVLYVDSQRNFGTGQEP